MKKLFKKTWPLWCIIPFIIWIVVAYMITPVEEVEWIDQGQLGETVAMVMYNGEWIGGNIIGDKIVLANGTEMDFKDFQRITGFKLE